MLPLSQATSCDSIAALAGLVVCFVCCCGVRILGCLIVCQTLICTLELSLFLLGVQTEARIVDALEEKVDVAERLEVDNDFDDGAQRHYYTRLELISLNGFFIIIPPEY